MHRVLFLLSVLVLVTMVGCGTPTPTIQEPAGVQTNTQARPEQPTPGYSSGGKSVGTWLVTRDEGVRILHAIDAIAPNDVWAAGDASDPLPEAKPQLVLVHWDGARWSKVAGLETGQVGSWYDTSIYGIEAIAPDNVWLVGAYAVETNKTSTLILHWNGATLELVQHPGTTGFKHELRAIAALAPDDIWAVGSQILHYNGNKWATIAGPDGVALDEPNMPVPDYGASLHGIAALTPDNIWAVGALEKDTLIIRWNGKSWSRVVSPNYEPAPLFANDGLWNYLNDISALSGDDIWAVGYATDNWMGDRAPSNIPLVLHWDGNRWVSYSQELSQSYPYATFEGGLQAVTAIATNEVWIGSHGSLRRWDGQTWHSEPCPAKELGEYQLGWIYDMTVVGGEVWVAGQAFYQPYPREIHSDYKSAALILDPSDGPCPTPTPMPTEPPPPTFPPPVPSVPTSVQTGEPYAPDAIATAAANATPKP